MTDVLGGIGSNPNVSTIILVALGCESVIMDDVAKIIARTKKPVETLVIQQLGGTKKTIAKGVKIARLLRALTSVSASLYPTPNSSWAQSVGDPMPTQVYLPTQPWEWPVISMSIMVGQ